MSKVNFNPQGTLIQNEVLQVPPMSHTTGIEFALSHDVFSSVDFSITYNGNTLEPQVDYILTQPYERARQEMGLTVYQRVKFLPAAPLGFTSTVYVTYRAVGDFMDADDFLSVSDSDNRYCKRSNNLSDVATPQTALKNLEDAASTTTDTDDFGYDSTNQSSQSDVMVLAKWGDGIPMKVPFKEFSEAVHDAVGDPLPIDKGGTNAQDADNAILNLIQGATSIRDDAIRDDTEIPCFTGSAYAQGSHFGKVSLLKIFNNWLKSKFQSWLGITVTESGDSITGRSFNGTSNKVANAITFSNDGAGAASGSTFDGSAARKLSYNSIGAAAAKDVYAFTYIVDSDQKLADWANNVSGNDYTSVLVKKNSAGWNLPRNKKLMTNGCLLLTGEPGAQINITNTVGQDIIQNINTIKDLKLNIDWTAASGSTNWSVFYHCNHIKNVEVALEHHNPNSYGTYINIFNSGKDVRDVVVGIHTNDIKINANLIRYQSHVKDTSINITGNHTQGSFIGIQGGSYHSNVEISNTGATIGTGIYNARRVTDCKVTGFSTSYDESYSSTTNDSTYACADTLEGGWNQ